MIAITPEGPQDGPAIETLLDEGFGAERRRKIAYRYRRRVARIDALGLVARDGERLVGTLRFWPIAIGEDSRPALLLGPIVVAASHRAQGLGARLMNAGLEQAARVGYTLVVLVGDEPYYGRFGFAPASPHAIVMPDENPARVLILALRAGALEGVSGTIRRVAPARASKRSAA